MAISIKNHLPAPAPTNHLTPNGNRGVARPRPRGFVELLGRSNFSFLQGASHPEEMVEKAITNGYDGIGLCDINGLYGVGRGYQCVQAPSLFTSSLKSKDSFRYLIGSEVVLTDETVITLMPMTMKGYTHLCRLLTLGKRQATKGFSRLSLEDLLKDTEDLLCFYLPPWNEEKLLRLKEAFKERLFLPIWRDFTWESLEFCQQAFKLEEAHDVSLFATNRPFMHAPIRKPLFDVLTCIHQHLTIDKAQQILIQNSERYLKPLEIFYNIWQDRPDLVEKTLDIAQMVTFSLSELRYRYPESNIPDGLKTSSYLKKLTLEGLHERFPDGIEPKVLEAVEHELAIIGKLEYEDYFLTLFEICIFAKEKGILYQGRGSAANSVVCYALGLTNVNPMEIDLLFERFISLERAEPPDIDIDFEHERREEVIQHIYEKYTEGHAAMVCTVIRYRSKMALREIAKVMNIPLKTINAMIKSMGRDGIKRLFGDPESREKFGIPEEKWHLLAPLCQELKGFPRHLGIHTGGFLISQNPINEIVPVEKASMNGRYVIQWNKDDVNNLKLMKIDCLSLGMLTVLRKALVLLKTHKGKDWNLGNLPREDKPTYDMMTKADTVGVFQIESRAQMNTLPRLKPKVFYDLVVEVALVRPGPLQGGMVHPYLKRRQGLEKVVYPHDDLIPILKKTEGIPIFQEQVMKIVVTAAGFTPGEADELRRIMSDSWRKQVTMDAVRERVMAGLLKHGLTEEFALQVYKTIEGFASYGFPESHAASFALLTYASSFIKCHYPDVFACAILNSQPMGFYSASVLLQDAERHGVKILPAHINISDYDYTLEGENAVRTGLRSIYGAKKEFKETLIQERSTNGPYSDLKDLVQRTKLPKSFLMKLICSDALSSFSEKARDLLWRLESLSFDENSFTWGDSKEALQETSDRELVPFESNWEKMERIYKHQGFAIGNHPLKILRPTLEDRSKDLRLKNYVPYLPSNKLPGMKHKAKVRLAGVICITQRPPTAKGFCFITLEDEFGFMNIVIPPHIYQQDRKAIYTKSFLEIHGFIERTGTLINIKAERVFPLAM